MKESIFSAAIRSFFVALFAMVGICFGFVFLIIIIAALSDTSVTSEIERTYTQEIVANADDQRKTLSKETPVVLKLNINGIIGTDELSMDAVRQQLIESREGSLADGRVKAILLCINSPGGTVVDSDGIYRAIKSYKEHYKVPVYAYVDGLCASGGMYVAAAADKVYASDVSLIGSIGVLSPAFFNFSQLMEKAGVQALTLTAGKGKDDLNPLRPWRPGEQDAIQALINYYYDRFVDIVTENRPHLDKEKLIKDYGAQVFSAPRAQEYGFITASGSSLNGTLKLLLKEIGIEDDTYQVMELQKKTWYSELFKTEWSLLKGRITHQIELVPGLNQKVMSQFLYLYQPEKLS